MSGDALDANLVRLRRAVARRGRALTAETTVAPTLAKMLEPVQQRTGVTSQASAPDPFPLVTTMASHVDAERAARPATTGPSEQGAPTVTPSKQEGPVDVRRPGWFARLLQRFRPRNSSSET
jgi:hypothetical protein